MFVVYVYVQSIYIMLEIEFSHMIAYMIEHVQLNNSIKRKKIIF